MPALAAEEREELLGLGRRAAARLRTREQRRHELAHLAAALLGAGHGRRAGPRRPLREQQQQQPVELARRRPRVGGARRRRVAAQPAQRGRGRRVVRVGVRREQPFAHRVVVGDGAAEGSATLDAAARPRQHARQRMRLLGDGGSIGGERSGSEGGRRRREEQRLERRAHQLHRVRHALVAKAARPQRPAAQRHRHIEPRTPPRRATAAATAARLAERLHATQHRERRPRRERLARVGRAGARARAAQRRTQRTRVAVHKEPQRPTQLLGRRRAAAAAAAATTLDIGLGLVHRHRVAAAGLRLVVVAVGLRLAGGGCPAARRRRRGLEPLKGLPEALEQRAERRNRRATQLAKAGRRGEAREQHREAEHRLERHAPPQLQPRPAEDGVAAQQLLGERGALGGAEQHEQGGAARRGVGEVRVVQREDQLQHVAPLEQRLVEVGAQPLLQQREQPQPVVAVRRRARVEVREEERQLVELQVRLREQEAVELLVLLVRRPHHDREALRDEARVHARQPLVLLGDGVAQRVQQPRRLRPLAEARPLLERREQLREARVAEAALRHRLRRETHHHERRAAVLEPRARVDGAVVQQRMQRQVAAQVLEAARRRRRVRQPRGGGGGAGLVVGGGARVEHVEREAFREAAQLVARQPSQRRERLQRRQRHAAAAELHDALRVRRDLRALPRQHLEALLDVARHDGAHRLGERRGQRGARLHELEEHLALGVAHLAADQLRQREQQLEVRARVRPVATAAARGGHGPEARRRGDERLAVQLGQQRRQLRAARPPQQRAPQPCRGRALRGGDEASHLLQQLERRLRQGRVRTGRAQHRFHLAPHRRRVGLRRLLPQARAQQRHEPPLHIACDLGVGVVSVDPHDECAGREGGAAVGSGPSLLARIWRLQRSQCRIARVAWQRGPR